MGNNQNYYDQIARYLNHPNKCLQFDLATYCILNPRRQSLWHQMTMTILVRMVRMIMTTIIDTWSFLSQRLITFLSLTPLHMVVSPMLQNLILPLPQLLLPFILRWSLPFIWPLMKLQLFSKFLTFILQLVIFCNVLGMDRATQWLALAYRICIIHFHSIISRSGTSRACSSLLIMAEVK